MDDPRNYYFELPGGAQPKFSPLNERCHQSYGWLSKHRARSRRSDVLDGVDTLVIHATAGYATQHAVDTWKVRKASAHWIVPDENEPQHGHFVWATVAEAKAAYHVRDTIELPEFLTGNRNINNRSLAIEVVNTQDVEGFSDPYSEWQIQHTANIVLHAWSKYPNLKHIVSHAKLDPTRRKDPGSNFPWMRFRECVLNHRLGVLTDPLLIPPAASPIPSDTNLDCCCP
ncbi:N-acetylmuramoyl-L-alanine amidase [Agarivorans sp. DSG3-1]|uniref:N-acetylmuramoyl-L-alanine amidase n=1 Tax=Agarivorans sp. DSG3-1 TaxID=3342249 RepID=UPI00398F3D0F